MVGSASIARCRSLPLGPASARLVPSIFLASLPPSFLPSGTHTLMPSGAFAHHMVWGAGTVRVLAAP